MVALAPGAGGHDAVPGPERAGGDPADRQILRFGLAAEAVERPAAKGSSAFLERDGDFRSCGPIQALRSRDFS